MKHQHSRDLTGYVVEHMLVTGEKKRKAKANNKGHRVLWRFICTICNSESWGEANHIRNGAYKNCRCQENIFHQDVIEYAKQKLVGKIFNQLKVIDLFIRQGSVFAECLCLKCNKNTSKFPTKMLGTIKTCKKCLMDRNNNSKYIVNFAFIKRIVKGAKSRNLIFDVSREELDRLLISQDFKCALTGEKLLFYKKWQDMYDYSNASLDRIDSSKGYIEGNVQWVTKQANINKQTLNNQEFFDFVKTCYFYLKDKYEKNTIQ